MSSKRRERTAAKARRRRVDLERLAPKVRQGITEGAGAREAMQELDDRMGKVPDFSGDDLVQQHLGGEQGKHGRVPVPRFVASDDTHSVWHDEPTGRLQRNAVLKIEKATYEAMLAGHICLRCLEPQDEAFPEVCQSPEEMGCSYPIRERQALDMRMEFRGEDHVGPGLPIAQFEADQQERIERAEHARRKKEGDSPMKFVSRRVLSPGAKRVRGLLGREHVSPELFKAVEEVGRAKKD
jgi:hypothetical protein